MHEWGHNWGLQHAWALDDKGRPQEYGDTTCAMGFSKLSSR